MLKLGLCMCAFSVLWCAPGILSESTTVKYTYNSSDLSYLSNGIQFPVAESEILELTRDNTTDESQFRWFSQLYDHFNWWPHLDKLKDPRCKDDMITYLKELRNGTWWALKSKYSNSKGLYRVFPYIFTPHLDTHP